MLQLQRLPMAGLVDMVVFKVKAMSIYNKIIIIWRSQFRV